MSTQNDNPDFEALLEYLKQSRGFDFTGYKRSSLMRRVLKRMQMVGIQTYSDYLDYLEVHPEEFIHLFNTLLINVTSFWRDRPAWDYIMEEIVPRIAARKEFNQPIRVWTAGCAGGQEAYTVAMVLAEALGPEQFRERVKIYATDVDDEALTQARQATYLPKEMEGVTPEYLEQYFERGDRGFVVRKELRRAVIFGRHNLTKDAPISRVDLLTCRNTLMYFNGETQAKILARFHFALQEGGFLFLGKAEMLLTHTNTFTPVDLKRRVFTKVPKISMRDRLLLMAQTGNEEAANNLSFHVRIREAAFESCPVAQVVVDVNGFLTLVNERARAMFGLNPSDLGRPLQDLEISYRPVELRSCIQQVNAERRPIHIREISWPTPGGETIYLDVQVAPLLEANGNLLGFGISFIDVSPYQKLHEALQQANQELEIAYEEQQSSNEELETTNEELQSSNEELETTNEELQSSHEELETMNEELQSSNEELQTLNDELRDRRDELNEVNAFLESILASLRGGVVVLDRDMVVHRWNHKAEDLWGLRSDEVKGQHFLNLDIGLPVGPLRQPIRNCLAGEAESQELVLDAINRRGRGIACKVTCMPLIGTQAEIRGVILLMEEQNVD